MKVRMALYGPDEKTLGRFKNKTIAGAAKDLLDDPNKSARYLKTVHQVVREVLWAIQKRREIRVSTK